MADPRRSGRALPSQSWPRREILDAYTRWCRDELFTPTMIRAAELLERACDLQLVEIYRQLDLASILDTPRTPTEVVRKLGFVESADITLDAMMWRLAHRTPHVVRVGTTEPPRYAHGDPLPESRLDLDRVWQEFDALGPEFRPCREFIEFGATHFETALREDPDLLDRVLSGREREFAEIWYRATNEDPLQNVHGVMGARAILDLFEGGRVLEIGGGTGNGIRNVLDLLARESQLERISHYTFTDIDFSEQLADADFDRSNKAYRFRR